jgi:hypothetical protein
MAADLPSDSSHADEVQSVLREHMESVPPGDSGVIDRAQLGLSDAEFAGTLELLRDLEQAGAVRVGEITGHDRVEFERLR